jgi:hypothetical protein
VQTVVVLARLGGAELSAIIAGGLFVGIMGFLLFWGGPPGKQ